MKKLHEKIYWCENAPSNTQPGQFGALKHRAANEG